MDIWWYILTWGRLVWYFWLDCSSVGLKNLGRMILLPVASHWIAQVVWPIKCEVSSRIKVQIALAFFFSCPTNFLPNLPHCFAYFPYFCRLDNEPNIINLVMASFTTYDLFLWHLFTAFAGQAGIKTIKDLMQRKRSSGLEMMKILVSNHGWKWRNCAIVQIHCFTVACVRNLLPPK